MSAEIMRTKWKITIRENKDELITKYYLLDINTVILVNEHYVVERGYILYKSYII